MKFILIATAMNLQLAYSSQEICNKALDIIKAQDPKAVCIPAGEQPIETMMESFFNMVKRLEEINQNKLTNKD